jgi:outer membrane protein TolC
MNKLSWLLPGQALRPWASGLLWGAALLTCLSVGAQAPHSNSTPYSTSNPNPNPNAIPSPAEPVAPRGAWTPTLAQALDAAWQRSVLAAQAQGDVSRARAEQSVVQRWLSASPALSLQQREGRAAGLPGSRETELGLALPLWWPGQRAAGLEAAQAQLAWAEAAREAARLQLAAQLGEAWAAAQQARLEQALARTHAGTLAELALDAQRRVKAGDLAPVDAMAAQADQLEAEDALRAATQALATHTAQWQSLTGWASPPGESPSPGPSFWPQPIQPGAALDPMAHPEQQMAEAALALAQRRLGLAQAQRSDAPELTLGLRQDQAGSGEPNQRSLAFGLRLPLGDDAQQQVRQAAALAELELARTQARRSLERLQAAHALAVSDLASARTNAASGQARAALLRERARWLDKAWRAGEAALPDVLRALGAAAQAELQQARQATQLALAQARLEHALGRLP